LKKSTDQRDDGDLAPESASKDETDVEVSWEEEEGEQIEGEREQLSTSTRQHAIRQHPSAYVSIRRRKKESR